MSATIFDPIDDDERLRCSYCNSDEFHANTAVVSCGNCGERLVDVAGLRAEITRLTSEQMACTGDYGCQALTHVEGCLWSDAHELAMHYHGQVLDLRAEVARLTEANTALRKAYFAAEADVARLRDHILDIDAHAAPLGEDDDGFVSGGYVISVGCLHRALGAVGHSAAKCKDLPCERAADLIIERDHSLGVLRRAVERVAALREVNGRLIEALRRLRSWDMLDAAGDGPWAKALIDEALAGAAPVQESTPAEPPDVCAFPKNGRTGHSWEFDGDDPRIVCHYCGEVRDAISGHVLRAASPREERP